MQVADLCQGIGALNSPDPFQQAVAEVVAERDRFTIDDDVSVAHFIQLRKIHKEGAVYPHKVVNGEFVLHHFQRRCHQVLFVSGEEVAVIAVGFNVEDICDKNFDNHFAMPHKNPVVEHKRRCCVVMGWRLNQVGTVGFSMSDGFFTPGHNPAHLIAEFAELQRNVCGNDHVVLYDEQLHGYVHVMYRSHSLPFGAETEVETLMSTKTARKQFCQDKKNKKKSLGRGW